jgi:hypothetical protein
MNCKDCNRIINAPFTLPNGDPICPPCLYNRHIRLLNDYNKLLLDFIDFAIKKQEFIKEMMNEMHKM